MKHVFGPVPSRRLGRSLGIDAVPLKMCNWNCVYCQLGRSMPLASERQCYYSVDSILDEFDQLMASRDKADFDWITLVGSGESTLYSDTGRLINELKNRTDIPIAVITNGSLLFRPEVRAELLLADAVLPSLDAGDMDLYRRINRPHHLFSFDRHVAGLHEFSTIYQGGLWLEVMLVKGINDSQEALECLSNILVNIDVDEIHLVQPKRCPAENWVQPPDAEGLARARKILGERIVVTPRKSASINPVGGEQLEQKLLAIVTRHPMRRWELQVMLDWWQAEEVDVILEVMLQRGHIQQINRYGELWFVSSKGHYSE